MLLHCTPCLEHRRSKEGQVACFGWWTCDLGKDFRLPKLENRGTGTGLGSWPAPSWCAVVPASTPPSTPSCPPAKRKRTLVRPLASRAATLLRASVPSVQCRMRTSAGIRSPASGSSCHALKT